MVQFLDDDRSCRYCPFFAYFCPFFASRTEMCDEAKLVLEAINHG